LLTREARSSQCLGREVTAHPQQRACHAHVRSSVDAQGESWWNSSSKYLQIFIYRGQIPTCPSVWCRDSLLLNQPRAEDCG